MTQKLTVQVKYRFDRQEVIDMLVAEASYFGPSYVLSTSSRSSLVKLIRGTVGHYGKGPGRHDELDDGHGIDEAKAIRQKIADLVDRLMPELRD